jgi:hypothetical protein
MTRMLEFGQAHGMEDGNKGRIKREGKGRRSFVDRTSTQFT